MHPTITNTNPRFAIIRRQVDLLELLGVYKKSSRNPIGWLYRSIADSDGTISASKGLLAPESNVAPQWVKLAVSLDVAWPVVQSKL